MSLALISGGKVKTAQELTKLSTPFFRDFMQGEGTAATGTWGWIIDASQTYCASYRTEGAGYFGNLDSVSSFDNYKWSNIFLAKGIYKATLNYSRQPDAGIAKFIFGTTLGTKDQYAASAAYNQLWELTFVIEKDTTADLKFGVTTKNAASSSYHINFSRLTLEKIG